MVVFAGELLKQAQELLRIGLHASDLVRGYNMASKKALELLKELSIYEVSPEDMKDEQKLIMGIKCGISSKQYGLENELSKLVAQACLNSMPKNIKNFVVDNIRTVKILGASVKESFIVKGMVVETVPKSSNDKCEDCKVVVFTCSLDATQTETKGTILLNNAKELINYNQSEEDHIHQIIKGLYEMGVRVVICGENLGELALHFIDKYKMVALKLSSKWVLRRICRATKARPCVQLSGVRKEDLGYCSKLYTQEIGSETVLCLLFFLIFFFLFGLLFYKKWRKIKKCKNTKIK